MEKLQTPPETNDDLAETESAMPPSTAPASVEQDGAAGTPVARTRKTAPVEGAPSTAPADDWRVESGRTPPEPLQPGETTDREIHRHDERGYWLLIVLPSRRQVSCRTDDRSKAERFKKRFDRGLPTIDAEDIELGKLLRNPPAGLKPMSDHDRKLLEPHWASRRVKDVTYHGTKAYYDLRRAVPAGVNAPTDQVVRGEIVELARYVRAATKTLDKDYRINVYLPKRSSPRTRWLRRSEAARFLWALRGRIWNPETNGYLVDPATGGRVLRDVEQIAARRYLARLVMLGLYTGSRLDVMLEACWSAEAAAANTALARRAAARKAAVEAAATGRHVPTPKITPFGHVDLDDDVFFRQGSGPTKASKQCPQVALVFILQVLVRGWRRTDTEARDPSRRSDRVIHAGHGEKWPLQSLKKAWDRVLADAGLDADVVRHTLRHTAATWLLESGYPIEETAEFLGVSVKELLKTYAHVDPAFSVEVAEAVDRYVAADPASRLRRIAALREAKAARLRAARKAARAALARALGTTP